MVKPNIGIINALIRITCGLMMVSWGTSRLHRKPHSNTSFITIFLGSMKVAEGITRFCPLVFLYKKNSGDYSYENSNSEPINPS
ncbi:hypothetical protein CR203_11940 [Salipaludibacillus neizhouensis]|uniref:Inner membrane protein YgaP-like transmembrane domain-containing protein n=1 Tax=Salipaludibacillus neizhouensis TaxID=885475 RepID=A0A3A9KC72_9BACI|nr:DUF2892 domain-containing protein [Salipaludibacillus neizhouensis]RKL67213.1 hypothetical protein CR203_11940 [Salipaludibacillus neizhouensis]